MNTFTNSSSSSVPPANTVTAKSSVLNPSATASTSNNNVLNQGAITTILASSSNQLTLATGSGKVSIPAVKIPPILNSGKDVSIKIITDKSTTLLEVAAKYSQQRLTLNSQQSQQVLQTVLQPPGSIANSLEVKGRVIAVLQNQIQVNVNGQSINLPVRNPQQYQIGQDVKLGLTSGTIGWEVEVQNKSIKESFRLPPEETQKILRSLTPTTPVELSEKGKKLISPLLKENSNSQLPGNINRVVLSKQPGNSGISLIAHLDIGDKPLATIKLNEQALKNLNGVELRSSHTPHQFRQNPLQTDINKAQEQAQVNAIKNTSQDTLQISQDNSFPKNAAKTSANNSVVYQSPRTQQQTAIQQNTSATNVSPDIANTIKASQEKFTELNVTSNKEPSPPIKEIRLSQQKDNHESSDKIAIAKNVEKPLSTPAQQILSTLRSLNTENAIEVKNTMLQNISKALESLNARGNNSAASPQPADVLKLMRTLTEQTSQGQNSSSAGQLNKLMGAIDELIANQNVEENVKSHVKQAIQQIKPEQSGMPLPDMQGIKQLLKASTLPVTPISIVTPPSGGGLVAGLINLLQVSMTARLNRSNQQAQEKLNNSLNNIVAPGIKPKTSSKPAGQNLKELSSLEQKHNMVKLLSDMVNQHSNQKMQNAERTLQGQEALYYVLPFSQREDQPPAELLIQRDKPEDDNKSEDKSQTSNWLLTMKLPIGELGEILTKSKVTEDKIELDMYTSSEELKIKTLNYLPLLKKRFDDLGIILEIGRCERGNIPDKLAKNPYQILETKV